MKLIYCPKCYDIVLLQRYPRSCACMASWGRYKDHRIAAIGGEAIPLGIDNIPFVWAVNNRPLAAGPGTRFDAFVIPMVCPTIVKDTDIRLLEEADGKHDSDPNSSNPDTE